MQLSTWSQRGAIKIGTIFTLIILAAGGTYVLKQATSNPGDKTLEENQSDPEKALVYYLRTAYKYVHNEDGGTIADVERTVTKDDWKWFNENDSKIFASMDAVNSRAVLGADQNAILSRAVALRSLYDMGPDRPDNIILKKNIGPTSANFTVRKQGMTPESYTDYEVVVVKEEKFWKVKDFAGARTRISETQ